MPVWPGRSAPYERAVIRARSSHVVREQMFGYLLARCHAMLLATRGRGRRLEENPEGLLTLN